MIELFLDMSVEQQALLGFLFVMIVWLILKDPE